MCGGAPKYAWDCAVGFSINAEALIGFTLESPSLRIFLACLATFAMRQKLAAQRRRS